MGLDVRKCACMSMDPSGGGSVEQPLCLGVRLILFLNSLITAHHGCIIRILQCYKCESTLWADLWLQPLRRMGASVPLSLARKTL